MFEIFKIMKIRILICFAFQKDTKKIKIKKACFKI